MASIRWTALKHKQGGGLLRYITSSSPAGLVSVHLEPVLPFPPHSQVPGTTAHGTGLEVLSYYPHSGGTLMKRFGFFLVIMVVLGLMMLGSSPTAPGLAQSGTWQLAASPTTQKLLSVALSGPNDGWAVGVGGTILRLSGGTWSTVPSPTTQDLSSVAVSGPNDGWVVGSGGTILRLSAGTWSTVPSPTTQDLSSVAVSGPNDGWAVGKGGTILRLSGGTWSVVASPTYGSLTSVALSGPNDGWAVGKGWDSFWGQEIILFLHLSGGTWSAITRGLTGWSLNSVALSGPNDGWAVGNSQIYGGFGIRLREGTWGPEIKFSTNSSIWVSSVVLSGPNNGWIVGRGGLILRWDGETWSIFGTPTWQNLISVAMSGVNDAWAVGENGTIIHYTSGGPGPTLTPTPTTTRTPIVTPTPTPTQVTCPLNQWRGEYYNNRDLQGSPVRVRCDSNIDFYWGDSSPIPDVVNTDNFSVRWTRDVDFSQAGWYRFRTFTDDGLRLYVDGERIIDDWSPRTFAEKSAGKQLAQGTHQVKMEYVEWANDAMAHLTWYQCPNGQGDCSMNITPQYQTQYLEDPMPNSCSTEPNQTIARWGCLITSHTMALQKLGINTNPRELNNWLSSHGGYTGDECTALLKSNDYIRYFALYKTGAFLRWVPVYNYDAAKSVIRDKQLPVIMQYNFADGGSHFFLAVDVARRVDGTEALGINDPHHAWACWVVSAGTPPPVLSRLQCSGSSLQHVTTVLDRFSGASPIGYLEYMTEPNTASLQFNVSGAEILLADAQGRRVGYDVATGQVVHEIPNSFYYDSEIVPPGAEPGGTPERVLFLPEEAGGNYNLQVIGVSASASSFEIGIAGFDSQFTPTENMVSGIVLPGQTAEYQVSFDPGQALRVTYKLYLPVLLKNYTYGGQSPTPTPTRTPPPQGPLPDKFLFAIGAQAPVGQFNSPYGVALAPDGTVYVADTGNQRIQRFSTTDQFLGTWGSQGSGDGQFGWPLGVAVASDGTVYVADMNNHRIQHFSATGQFLGKWGSQGSGDGQFQYPHGVAVAPDGTVYVADSNNHRIQHFSATGQFLGQWGSQGSGDGQFNHPEGVAVAPDGAVYVADSGNHRIQRFSATGQFLGQWGSQGSGDGQFQYPQGVAVAPDGTVYVADSGNDRIQRFSATGQFLDKWGSYGSGDGQFDWPSGVAVASDGTVYVADTFNDRIQRFSATGSFLGKWGSGGSGDGQFWSPWGVSVAADGTV